LSVVREAADARARAMSPIEDAVLCVGESERGPELHALAGGTACLYTARALGRERTNEDAVALIPFDEDSGVIAVADGVGGLPAGALAAGAAVQALQSTLAASRERGQTLRSAILDGIEHANHAVLESGIGAAATFAVVEIEGLRMRPFHIGDCEILLMGQRGRLKLQTISHAPVAQAVDAGMLDREAAMHHADRHLVSNVVGATDMRIEMGSWRTIAARDTLVVASDGLCDNLRLDEIVARARKGPLATIARELVAMAQARMRGHEIDAPSKPDDLSFVLFRPGRTPPRPAPGGSG
jgi:serine/threonine protein phosphatase PrpC